MREATKQRGGKNVNGYNCCGCGCGEDVRRLARENCTRGGCRGTTGYDAGYEEMTGVADVMLGRGAIPTGGSEDFGFIRVVSSTFRRWIPRLVCNGQPTATPPARFDPPFFGISPRTRATRRSGE